MFFRRFTSLLFAFLCSIFILVFSADLLRLFVAWDLLGFTSFFLVIFYRSRSSLAGGILTCLINRVGDVFLFVFFGLSVYSSSSQVTCALFLLIVVSFTKSAQVPFSSWLPAAILAPTPVSALVHSSTLVTAGVYLLLRFSPSSSSLMVSVGLFTTLMAGIAASLECDAKKIIALSTLRQLGLIVTSLGLGARSLCFAHLNTHAAFKALLFLAIGSYIHSIYGSQEARSVVTLHSNSPLTLVVLITASLSICGIVFLSGWVTKEAILESRFNNSVPLCSLFAFYLGIGLTLVYSLRLSYSLCASTRHISILTPTFSCSLPSKSPMCWLFMLSVIQGINIQIIGFPSIITEEDKLVVLGIILVSARFAVSLRTRAATLPTTITYLGHTTSFISSLSGLGTTIHHTEVTAFQGGGLACLASILSPLRLGTHVFLKITLTLSLVFVIL